MRILVVGAGATGGYFGGRLALPRAELRRYRCAQLVCPRGPLPASCWCEALAERRKAAQSSLLLARPAAAGGWLHFGIAATVPVFATAGNVAHKDAAAAGHGVLWGAQARPHGSVA